MIAPTHPLSRLLPALVLLGASLGPAQAATVGVNPPPPPLSEARVARLPEPERAAWQAYLARSEAQGAADRAALAEERRGLTTWPAAPEGGHAETTMPLDRPAAWYRGEEARRVAQNILSFQTPAGGWGKNQPRNRPPRQRGQAFVSDNNSPFVQPGDFDIAREPGWSYVGTTDNDATITEIRFLARLASQAPGDEGEPWRRSALRGLDYLLQAQFPNGGWPQVWPLQGGYHDAVTLNDNAMVEVAELMSWVARGEDGFDFAPPALRERAARASQRATDWLLDAQIHVDGRLTLWAQQHDPLDGTPVSARNYEPPALCAAESAATLHFLMSLPEPSPRVRAAVQAGVATLESLARHGVAWEGKGSLQGRHLVHKAGAGPLWARFYSLPGLQPLFGDRDKSLHDDVNEISRERREGYGWWGSWPAKVLAAYPRWAERWPLTAEDSK